MILTEDAIRGPTGRQPSRNQKRAERAKQRSLFGRARRAEMRFSRQLRKVANQVGAIVSGMAPGGIVRSPEQLADALARYADLLRPWAKSVAEAMVDEAARRDRTAWTDLGRILGRNLREEIAGAPTGEAMREIMDEAVDLITSLPREASQRVHRLVIEGMEGGTRAAATAREILRTEQVTKSRAMLIARTETTRAASALVEARARHVGSEGYIWRTVGDADVRELHKRMEGKFIRWDAPPQMEPNLGRYHAGAGPNCRCWPEVVLPDDV